MLPTVNVILVKWYFALIRANIGLYVISKYAPLTPTFNSLLHQNETKNDVISQFRDNKSLHKVI